MNIYDVVRIPYHKKRQKMLRRVIERARKFRNITIVTGLSHQGRLETHSQ